MNPKTTTVYEDMFTAASICGSAGLEIAALVILYSVLDTLAWVEFETKSDTVSKRFESFCNKYELPKKLGCSATDLYSARCSILHNLGWESDLNKKGKAKSFYYDFGPTASSKQVQPLIDKDPKLKGKFCRIHADTLFNSIRNAHNQLVESSKTDDTLQKRMDIAKQKQYSVRDTTKLLCSIQNMMQSNCSI